VEFTAISWNLFHGRDFPPDPELRSWRSRLLRIEERNATHVQVNRDMSREFATVLAGAAWDVALLQECPPRFVAPLARACGAEAHRALTSRNSLGPLRGLLARQNPDLMASGEGGSNLTLIRKNPFSCSLSAHGADKEQLNEGAGGVSGLGGITERRELAIHDGPPERRAMALTRTASGVCVANLHASNDAPDLASEDVLRAARAAGEFADGAPLLFGGDLNLRPAEEPAVFERLREDFGLGGPAAPRAIDHLLGRGLEPLDPPTAWPPERRELALKGRALRLSDHAPVQARFSAAEPTEAADLR
jgi:Endonuclease/Exonuclease/phosphatase family